MKRPALVLFLVLLVTAVVVGLIWVLQNDFIGAYRKNREYSVGQPIDSLHGVVVYYNGGVGNSVGRTTTADNYNIGKKYQCVEFVKRYYYQRLNHKMPDSYGHAKDFYNVDLADGQWNEKRGLIQYSNGSRSRPDTSDLIIFNGSFYNPYGHVAIVSAASDQEIEIIQQNPGPFAKSRVKFGLMNKAGKWFIAYDRVLGWLRKGEQE